jgi:phosphoribosylformylglycinamidine synthase
MCGICNGFQALIKLGLVPYGEIREPKADSPTLTYNEIGRHQSRIVYTRIVSNMSPWLSKTNPGDVYAVPISHGEGRFIASDETIEELAAKGQIATQYCDETGRPSYDIRYNPNGSCFAIEGITSPDGRVIGRMGHVERNGAGLYKNVQSGVPFDAFMFESAVMYFR